MTVSWLWEVIWIRFAAGCGSFTITERDTADSMDASKGEAEYYEWGKRLGTADTQGVGVFPSSSAADGIYVRGYGHRKKA